MIPRVSSSSSRTAQRRGLKISRRRHPPVTNVHSLYLRSWTKRNFAGPFIELLTGIAILLCLSSGRSFRVRVRASPIYYWTVKIISQVSRMRIICNQKYEAYEKYPRPELHPIINPSFNWHTGANPFPSEYVEHYSSLHINRAIQNSHRHPAPPEHRRALRAHLRGR